MTYHTRQKDLLMQSGTAETTQKSITLGTVVDTNDPQEMGRVRAVCPAWGDTFDTPFESVPWCMYISPFGGQLGSGARGPEFDESDGGIAYGMWAIPKVGAQVVVLCLDGDPQYRAYFGCVFEQHTPHTMPHGRWMYEDHPALESDGSTAKPAGPYTSREHFIEPLHTNLEQAFGGGDPQKLEAQTRAADYTAAAVSLEDVDRTLGQVADDKGAVDGDWTSFQGYGLSRIDPLGESSLTDRNNDSPVYAFTTPGFHAFSMDDRQENCRIRFRSSAGHQIILDDTNERVYIQTAKGNNWIELDQAGNIDIYSSGNISVRSAKDINFTADETIRLNAGKGVHISTDELRLHAASDMHLQAGQNLRAHGSQSVFIEADQTVNIKAGQSFFMSAASELNAKCGAEMKLTSGGNFNNNSGGMILETASMIHMNGPSASTADDAQGASEETAFLTSRVPDHEPWARTMTKDDTSTEPEFPYSDENVNRSERGTVIERGPYWRR